MSAMEPPVVTITQPALDALRAAATEMSSDEVLHLSIDGHFRSDLYFARTEAKDVLVAAAPGLTLAMDRSTARRADGLTIDFIDGPTAGFKLENPNQSSPVKGTRPAEVVEMLRKREKLELVDVRDPAERAKAKLEAARPLDAGYEAELLARKKDAKLVFLSHHSQRSRRAAQRFFDRGFTNVWYVVGGMDAWSTWDASVPRY